MKNKKILLSIVVVALFLAVFATVSDLPQVERNKCVGCGDCVKHCPTNAINLRQERAEIDPDLCINRRFCVKTCAYRAIRTPK